MSNCITQGIRIAARPFYLSEQSNPEAENFLFGYEITITNESDADAMLVDRHWIIKDAQNRVEEVEGDGVIGQTPLLEPGQSFTYQSYCPLSTNYGFMRGSYGMVRADGERFEAEIAPFALLPQWMLN
ncbi:ApaG protein [Abditibacterium utsteinense]|uniref:ApaG protein n=1 Tax=Abditibacterium utsteinense TaxID=1960156 RepID=A0A2S8SPM5_9BACT|nr:Co2+/Mg2+ efflux protein ApaG [Abditibacterium utsteinense]PQV62741.1 ApaG protein [Abditibacterium utsteinense]